MLIALLIVAWVVIAVVVVIALTAGTRSNRTLDAVVADELTRAPDDLARELRPR